MIRFYNGKLMSMESGTDITCDEVWVEGDKIAYVGPPKEYAGKFDREIDLNGNLLMPGFKNAHTHSPMTFLRSYADDVPLDKWLFEKIFPMEAKLDASCVYEFTKLAILEYLTSGITASFDMYYEPEAYAEANVDMGFRTVLCGAVNDFKESVPRLEEYYNKFNNYHPLISYRLGFHAEYTTNLDNLKAIAGLSQSLKAGVYTHNSETRSEVEGCIERYGKTPTELFDSIGLFEYGGGGFHNVYMTDKDLEIFKEKHIYAVTNPGSNSKLASGIAPIEKMLHMGIDIAIGTDVPASNNALDMFREMYLVTVLQKLSNMDAAACPAEDVLKMAASTGAKAMGLDDCDSIAVGKQADLIVIDLNRPNMQPINNIAKNIVYSGSKENVKLTMIAGRILYENGEFFVGEKANDIYAKVNALTEEIKNRK